MVLWPPRMTDWPPPLAAFWPDYPSQMTTKRSPAGESCHFARDPGWEALDTITDHPDPTAAPVGDAGPTLKQHWFSGSVNASVDHLPEWFFTRQDMTYKMAHRALPSSPLTKGETQPKVLSFFPSSVFLVICKNRLWSVKRSQPVYGSEEASRPSSWKWGNQWNVCKPYKTGSIGAVVCYDVLSATPDTVALRPRMCPKWNHDMHCKVQSMPEIAVYMCVQSIILVI